MSGSLSSPDRPASPRSSTRPSSTRTRIASVDDHPNPANPSSPARDELYINPNPKPAPRPATPIPGNGRYKLPVRVSIGSPASLWTPH